jgi:hypothetical protein
MNNTTKFGDEWEIRFGEQLELLHDVSSLTNTMGRLLSENAGRGDFAETSLHFAMMTAESPANILRTLRDGYIAHAVVLSRWYLEMAHLCFYLWSNPDAHKEWLAGKNVRPKDIGQWFNKMGFPTWKETYDDWSNVVHNNSLVVSAYHTIAARTPVSEGQFLVASQLIRNLLFITTKLNYVFGKTLKPFVGDRYAEIALKYNSFEKRILEISDAHNRWERSFMDSRGDNGQAASESETV